MTARGEDPACYRKCETWWESLRASVTALAAARQQAATAGFKPVATATIRGGDQAQHLVVPVAGVTELWLTATFGPDTYNHDRASWCDPVLIDRDGKTTPLTTLTPSSVKVGWGELLLNRSLGGGPLRVADRDFQQGFWAHAPSQLGFRLDGRYERFEVWVGIEAGAGKNGSSEFIVQDQPQQVSQLEAVWPLLARDFTTPEARRQIRWEREDGIWSDAVDPADLAGLSRRYAAATHRVPVLREQASAEAATVTTEAQLAAVRELYLRSRRVTHAVATIRGVDAAALARAIEDLSLSFPRQYAQGAELRRRLDELQRLGAEVCGDFEAGVTSGRCPDLQQVEDVADRLAALQRQALLANPLLDFDRLLLVRRKETQLGLPQNWQGNSSLPRSGYDNEIAVLSPVAPDGTMTTLYRPEGGEFVGDLDLHFGASRLLFSSIGTHGRWQVFEIKTDGSGQRQVTPGDQPDVDNYDACYLPDGGIAFCSTLSYAGVPCVWGGDHVAVLCRLEADGTTIRQLGFEQDHDWCPTVLADGRLLYQRWEYTDTPHSNTRLLFTMNPDGTEQRAYYGSNSYWPNSMFFARPIPGHPTKVVTIATGHHGHPRQGELVVLDPALGRYEATGAVQRIPGYAKKVEPVMRDALANGSWPLLLHPFPLSEKYVLVSCKPTPESPWGLYLVDVFDNLLLLAEQPGYALFEPVPLRRTPTPPVIPPRVDLRRRDALVHLGDVYAGPGLTGIPRGTVKRLRLISYHFAYRGMGGLLGVIGMDGPWDVKQVLGTVPVAEDGSAYFRIPANTPIAVQPLDAEGKALQLMRSWFAAMPGETLSCTGCHESNNTALPSRREKALRRAPDEITPWYGPGRGFAFRREVQPVLDRACVPCHQGQPGADGLTAPDLRDSGELVKIQMVTPGNGTGQAGSFSRPYLFLHRFVRRPGIESDYHLLTPMEFHADTTALFQLLRKGHYGVRLDPEAWDRLATWVDLNAPFYGTWGEIVGRDKVEGPARRRRELAELYAGGGGDGDPEAIPEPSAAPAGADLQATNAPVPDKAVEAVSCPGWPVAKEAASARQAEAANGGQTRRSVDLGEGVTIELALVPPGEFVMGDAQGQADERPLGRVRLDKPFWVGVTEVSNQVYARFDPSHDSRVEDKNAYQFGVHGYPLNEPNQPVVRVSWLEAMAFCRWLSQATGETFALPTEAQWEYACRAGADTAFWFGGLDADYSRCANVADKKLREFASNPYTIFEPLANATEYDDWIPRDDRFNDNGLLTVAVGTGAPNPWGLKDMHGNASEWTRTSYRAYPYRAEDGRDDPATPGDKAVRGGSWYDRPSLCRAAVRQAYRPYQRVHNVGFRVVMESR